FAGDRPEDLRFLDPKVAGVAYIATTVILGTTGISFHGRLDPLDYPQGAAVMPVVRIEARAETLPPRENVIPYLLPAAEGAHALQIDFDPGDSQRYWYFGLLADLRRALPADKRLSVAVRPEWCAPGGWIEGLPVDEAVPLLFRGAGEIALPVCQSSAGVWGSEAAPRVTRLYRFHPLPWTADAYKKLVDRR
ncbi:MAG TPA: hypothetical protein VIO38_12735, partial [Rariglobus sp.]